MKQLVKAQGDEVQLEVQGVQDLVCMGDVEEWSAADLLAFMEILPTYTASAMMQHEAGCLKSAVCNTKL